MYPCNMLHVPWLILAVYFCFPGECGAQLVRDSAGARIITYREDTAPPEHWVAEDTTLQLGGADRRGVQEFWRVVGIAVLSNRSLVVGDIGSSELRFFNVNTGEHIRTVAGRGHGPGEIDHLWQMWTSGDTIVARDNSGLASYFDAEGIFQRREFPIVSTAARRFIRAGLFLDGTSLAYRGEHNPNPRDGTVAWMQILSAGGDGQ